MGLKKCVLSFIDILGFANQVQGIDSERKLKSAQRKLRKFVSNLGVDEDHRTSIDSFSDCVIRTVALGADDNVKEILKSEIRRLCSVTSHIIGCRLLPDKR